MTATPNTTAPQLSPPMVADRQLEELGGSGFALAMQMLGRRDDAADAVQDGLHQLVRKWQTYDAERGELKTWFLTIVRNRCVDLMRQRARKYTEHAEFENVAGAGGVEPGAVVEQRESVAQLKAELMKLPDEQREILVLRDFHNLSYAEVAKMLSIPKGTVMSRLHRARTALRERMEKFQ